METNFPAGVFDPMKLAHRVPEAADIPDIEMLRKDFMRLVQRVHELCPNGRERSLALTHIETATMYAVKSIVCRHEAPGRPERRPPAPSAGEHEALHKPKVLNDSPRAPAPDCPKCGSDQTHSNPASREGQPPYFTCANCEHRWA